MLIRLLLFLSILMGQDGKFYSGFQAEDHGVSIGIIEVQSGPRCRHYDNCPWMLQWGTKRKSDTVEIAVTLAGRPIPEPVVIVPGSSMAPLDKHNPVFALRLAEVYMIEFTLRRGAKEVGHATFK